jgi:gamma-glutamyltranspeptidase
VGQIFRNRRLAAAYKLIAAQGAVAFYKGDIARAILKTSARLGGKMAAEDLAEFQSEWVEPVSTEYRGWKVYEMPPNSQGIAALEMLNILETFPLFNLRACQRGRSASGKSKRKSWHTRICAATWPIHVLRSRPPRT